MLNKASRSRSVVGRTASVFGLASGRERNLPPTTRIILTLAAKGVARPNGHGGGVCCHFEATEFLVSGIQARGRSPAPLKYGVWSLARQCLMAHRNRCALRRRSALPAWHAIPPFRLP